MLKLSALALIGTSTVPDKIQATQTVAMKPLSLPELPPSGNLKAFVRMDGAWLGSIDIAIRKARTARYFDLDTAEIGKMSQPGQPLYGVEHSNGGLVTFGGGIPLKDADGTVIGAIGVSGSTVDNDVKVANAAVEACNGRKFATA